MKQRVQKILREWGIASRRQAEKMILDGRVKINERPIKLGDQADPKKDKIKVDGKVLTNRPPMRYILLHKPKGVVSTCSDPQNRPTVLDLLDSELKLGQGIHPIGRLDRNSTGALLLTNDGELTLKLTHPRYHLSKIYHVWVKGNPSDSILRKWREGIVLEGTKTEPAQVEILTQKPTKTLLKIVIYEGRNRQIRKIADLLGFPVLRLHRVSVGSIKLSSLPCGEYRFLENWEVKKLKQK
jgi:pseudouridine synthase